MCYEREMIKCRDFSQSRKSIPAIDGKSGEDTFYDGMRCREKRGHLFEKFEDERSDSRYKCNRNDGNDAIQGYAWNKFISNLHNYQKDNKREKSKSDEPYRKSNNSQQCAKEEIHESEDDCEYEHGCISLLNLDARNVS